jgi:hypothetical protein
MVERNDEVTRMAHELGNVIRRTLAGSQEVADCLARIKGRGYELSVALEATVAFTPAAATEGEAVEPSPRPTPAAPLRPGSGRMTPLDKKFLRSLKISVEDDE